ncbi:50S ribosomal protein L11 [ANME-1 cluster archaeon ex4572_4]|nr:50S ribosomal protein L11 [Methanophagales archaeon]OYT66934.1 MAG: 50S ribosomal protein L11 [ANME-1 cluster archaeon ex4572_4]PXF51830.1 MAG: 50S ribosomal protein L11 [Methanophagales archaeon]HDN68903.1 50S ribosomal protein L11 [Methanomicrobia archaeon]
MNVVEVLVEGGKASAGPPLGPALGPLGVSIKEVVERINELTRDFAGMKVPVKVTVVAAGKAEITVGTPPTAALLKKELGIEKAKTDSTTDFVGDISLEQVKAVAKKKREGMLAASLKSAVKEVLGTCVSMRVKVEGKEAKEVQREIEEGKFDETFS